MNDAESASTKATPVFLVTGQNPRMPLDLLSRPPSVPCVAVFVIGIHHSLKAVKHVMLDAQIQQEQYADNRRLPKTCDIGDELLLNTQDTPIAKRPAYKIKDLALLRPFRCFTPHHTPSTSPKTSIKHNVFHVSMLRPY